VPADNSFRSDDDDRLLPSRPHPTDGDPEELVNQIESRPRTTPFQHGQLLSQRDFSKIRSWRLRKVRGSDPSASHSTLSIIGVITEFWQRAAGYVIGFKVGQSCGEPQVPARLPIAYPFLSMETFFR
jgi:hypothetical protein